MLGITAGAKYYSCRWLWRREQGVSQAAEKLKIEPALYQGTTSQAAEKLGIEPVLYQGTTSQAAEKLLSGGRPGIYPRHKANGINAGFSP